MSFLILAVAAGGPPLDLTAILAGACCARVHRPPEMRAVRLLQLP
jgi:hypothetical protein